MVPAYQQWDRASRIQACVDAGFDETLIHVGEDDARVPVTHSRALHRALHYYIEAPCELIVYPGAGHGLTEYRHQLSKLQWDHAWFDRYLKGEEPEAD